MSGYSFQKAVIDTINTVGKGQMGGATKGGKLGPWGRLGYALLWSFISLAISGAIVHWAYNRVAPKILVSKTDQPFVPITWEESMILVLLTHALIW